MGPESFELLKVLGTGGEWGWGCSPGLQGGLGGPGQPPMAHGKVFLGGSGGAVGMASPAPPTAYGKVFLVRKVGDADSGHLYAMKVLRKAGVAGAGGGTRTRAAERARTERAVLGRVRGAPFLVTLHYAFQTRTRLHLVLGTGATGQGSGVSGGSRGNYWWPWGFCQGAGASGEGLGAIVGDPEAIMGSKGNWEGPCGN